MWPRREPDVAPLFLCHCQPRICERELNVGQGVGCTTANRLPNHPAGDPETIPGPLVTFGSGQPRPRQWIDVSFDLSVESSKDQRVVLYTVWSPPDAARRKLRCVRSVEFIDGGAHRWQCHLKIHLVKDWGDAKFGTLFKGSFCQLVPKVIFWHFGR